MNIVKQTTHLVVALCVILSASHPVWGQTAFPRDSLVIAKCSACHKPDQQGRIEVIEETRKTPEEWINVVDRMIRLNDLALEDDGFHPVIKELSWYLCLSPKEMAEVAYINSDENSQYREIPKNDLEKRMFTACVRCHTWGKMASHRNTPAQWSETRTMHLAYYPTSVAQMREMNWPKEFEDLIEPLSKMFPFESAEWRQWMASRTDPDLSGEWTVAGYQPGKGYYTGSYRFSPDPEKGKDEYLIEKRLAYENGSASTLQGTGTLYAGYHLRFAMTTSGTEARIEGVFDLDAEDMGFTGKWWDVIQDRNAFGNESFFKVEKTSRIIAAFPQSLATSTGGLQDLRIVGVNLTSGVQPSDISFSSPHVVAKKINKADHSEIALSVEVSAEAEPGPVTVGVKGARLEHPIILYDHIDGIKIFPAIGRARVAGGPAYPPQGVQFVARAVDFGKDGKADTEDDLILEPVDARWWLEEEDTSVSTLMKGLRLAGVYPKFGRETDEDLKYLNTTVENGLYTPVTTYAPIKERIQHVQGTGLIAIGAAFTEDGKEFKGRSLLAVVVPDFVPHMK